MSALVWGIIIGIIIILLVVIFFLRKSLKTRQEKFSHSKVIPKEVIERFNALERRYEEELNDVKNGRRKESPNPYNIIWEDAKRNRNGETIDAIPRGNEPIATSIESDAIRNEYSDSNRCAPGRESVQIQSPPISSEDKQDIGNSKRDSIDNARSKSRRESLLARIRNRRGTR